MGRTLSLALALMQVSQHVLQTTHSNTIFGRKQEELMNSQLPHIMATRVYRCTDAAKVFLYPTVHVVIMNVLYMW